MVYLFLAYINDKATFAIVSGIVFHTIFVSKRGAKNAPFFLIRFFHTRKIPFWPGIFLLIYACHSCIMTNVVFQELGVTRPEIPSMRTVAVQSCRFHRFRAICAAWRDVPQYFETSSAVIPTIRRRGIIK